MSDELPILVLIRDLMFTPRVTAAAKAVNKPFKLLRDPAKLAGEPGTKLIIDLTLPGAIEAAQAWKQTTGGTVIGFVGHSDIETINKARSAGIDQVMAKGAFVESLPTLL